ncbi:MAG TPA: hypothetical protein VEI07_10200 [Planctomycetaceae bacterium]|nr:hypothetical protein [Planctomycetaceae bacterium]
MSDALPNPNALADALKVIHVGQRCRFLLSKGMAVNAGLPEDEHIVGDGHFWCTRTQRIYGPDGGLCADEPCRESSRSCYESR